MIIEDRIIDEKPQYDIIKEAAKISALSSGKIINMNFLLVKKYCPLINSKLLKKLNLLILLWERLLRNKQKQLKIKEKNK